LAAAEKYRVGVYDQGASDLCHNGSYLQSQTSARCAKDNPAHNGSTRREAKVL